MASASQTVATVAADLLGDADAEQPLLRRGQVQRTRDLLRVLPLVEVRADLALDERAYGLLQRLLLRRTSSS